MTGSILSFKGYNDHTLPGCGRLSKANQPDSRRPHPEKSQRTFEQSANLWSDLSREVNESLVEEPHRAGHEFNLSR